MIEEWRLIVGFPGYEVSNFGRVRSFWKLRSPKGKGRGGKFSFISTESAILKNLSNSNGYALVFLRQQARKMIAKTVHGLVLATFVEPRPEGKVACHKDGKRMNARLDNLRWDSPANNEADKILHGTTSRGSQNSQARLDETCVLRIRAMLKQGMRVMDIARQFGIVHSAISQIKSGKTWTHVK